MSVKPISNEDDTGRKSLTYEKYCKENDEFWENERNIVVRI